MTQPQLDTVHYQNHSTETKPKNGQVYSHGEILDLLKCEKYDVYGTTDEPKRVIIVASRKDKYENKTASAFAKKHVRGMEAILGDALICSRERFF